MREKISSIRPVFVCLVICSLTPAIVSPFAARPIPWGAPLERMGSITSCYGPRHLLNKFWNFHKGVDFGVKMKTLVRAIGEGRVIFEGPSFCAGRTLVIEHKTRATTYLAIYEHLKGYLVKLGEDVHRGQFIGLSGASGSPLREDQSSENRGCVLGPHLHFELKRVPTALLEKTELLVKNPGGRLLATNGRATDPALFWPEVRNQCLKKPAKKTHRQISHLL